MTDSLKDKLKNILEKIEQGAEGAGQEIKKNAGEVEQEVKKEFEKKAGEQKK